MRTLDSEEIHEVSGALSVQQMMFGGTAGMFQAQIPSVQKTLGELLGMTAVGTSLHVVDGPIDWLVAVGGDGDTADEVTITCKKPSSGADNDGGFGDCWLDKAGLWTGALGVVARLAVLAGAPPLAAVFTALAGMVGAVAAFSCLVHILGDFCWTEHRFWIG